MVGCSARLHSRWTLHQSHVIAELGSRLWASSPLPVETTTQCVELWHPTPSLTLSLSLLPPLPARWLLWWVAATSSVEPRGQESAGWTGRQRTTSGKRLLCTRYRFSDDDVLLHCTALHVTCPIAATTAAEPKRNGANSLSEEGGAWQSARAACHPPRVGLSLQPFHVV